jgi:hypothetical protein
MTAELRSNLRDILLDIKTVEQEVVDLQHAICLERKGETSVSRFDLPA